MAKIQIQRQFWNQFWSLIPKTVSNLNFFHEKWHFLNTKNSVFWHFWVPKIILLVKKKLNLKSFLESVTKTDFETGFGFELRPFLWILVVFGPFWYIQVTFCKVHLSNLAKNNKPQSKKLEVNHVVGCDIYTKLSVRNEYFEFSPFTPP